MSSVCLILALSLRISFPLGKKLSVALLTLLTCVLLVPPQAEDPSHPNPREVWSFTAIERIFRAVKLAARLNAAGYMLFGHSAGAQFVHRLVAFAHREAGAEQEEGQRTHLLRAVAANAGAYMLPTFEERYPFGFGGLEEWSSKDLAAFVSAPLTVLLGQDDTGPHFTRVCVSTRQYPPMRPLRLS